MPQKIERWKIIKDFPDYAISNCGKLRRATPGSNRKIGSILKPQKTKNGYLYFILSKNKKIKSKRIHILVLETFKCKRPIGLEPNHIDRNKSNNCIDNLEWITHKQNIIHSFKDSNRIILKGERVNNSKLKEENIIKIRKLYDNNYKQKEIARMFNVNQSQISRIINKKRWRHI